MRTALSRFCFHQEAARTCSPAANNWSQILRNMCALHMCALLLNASPAHAALERECCCCNQTVFWVRVKTQPGSWCTAHLYSIAAGLQVWKCLCKRLPLAKASPKNPCARNGVAAVAVGGWGGKGAVCSSYFMEISLYLTRKTPSLREGNSCFISMDALFLHIRSAVLLCQSSR